MNRIIANIEFKEIKQGEESILLGERILGSINEILFCVQRRKFFNYSINLDDFYVVPEIELCTLKCSSKDGIINMVIGTTPIHAKKFFKYIKRHPVDFSDLEEAIELGCKYESIDYRAKQILGIK